MWTTLSGYTTSVNDPCANDHTSIYACLIASDVQRWCCVVDKTFKIQELTEQALGSVLYICPFICSITAGLRLFCVYLFICSVIQFIADLRLFCVCPCICSVI